MEDFGKKPEAIKSPKASQNVALFLAAALAGAAGGAAAMSEYKDSQNSPRTLENPISQDFGSSDYVSEEYTSTADTGTFEFPASKEAIQAVIGLDKTVGRELRATPEQRAQVRAVIDAYVAQHPPVQGESGEQKEADGSVSAFNSSSYDPYSELWNAATKLGISSALQGVLQEELADRMASATE
jgi:hypothetical protein